MADQDRAEAAADRAPIPRSRALVALEAIVRIRADERPLAGFVTQLIACQRRFPAYRPVRTAEPALAASLYGARNAAPALTLDRDA